MDFNAENLKKLRPLSGDGSKLYIETYGCQMNVSDSEVVLSILQRDGYRYTERIDEADVILVNTCSVRDNAEQRVLGRLREFKPYKRRKKALLVGVIGCMAERMKEQLMEREQLVDIVAGPDSYRDLPRLLRQAGDGSRSVNVLLSQEETYAEIAPVRLDKNGVSAFISIMRGCNNMCSYCVVPYTRGAERSRDPRTILREARELFDAGYREVTLLGQNVNSYRWEQDGHSTGFAALLDAVAGIDPLLRVRFSTSHPKDLSDEVLHVMARRENLCRAIHLPAQSGQHADAGVDEPKIHPRVVPRPDRRDPAYLARLCAVDRSDRRFLHRDRCGSSRHAVADAGKSATNLPSCSNIPNARIPKLARHFADDVPDEVKTARLTEIIDLQNELSLQSNRRDVGRTFEVLIEGSFETQRRPAVRPHVAEQSRRLRSAATGGSANTRPSGSPIAVRPR